MNWLLLVAIMLIGGFAVVGWKVGFVKTVFSLVSTIVIIILTMIFSPIITNILKSSDSITGAISSRLEMVIDLSGIAESMDQEDESDPMAFMEGLELPDSIKSTIKDALTKTMQEKDEELADLVGDKLDVLEGYVCEFLTSIILNAIGFFVTFIIAAVGVAVLCFVMDVISKLPVLHQLNTLAGVAIGALEGLVVLWIVFVVITMLGSTEFGQASLAMVGESKLLSFLYDSNVLAKLILRTV